MVGQQFDFIGEVQSVFFVPERFAVQIFFIKLADDSFAVVPERRMSQIVRHGDGAGELVVEFQPLRNGIRRRFHVQHVLHPRADMVVFDVVKHLRFMLQAAVRRRVKHPRVIARERRAHLAFFGIQSVFTPRKFFVARIAFIRRHFFKIGFRHRFSSRKQHFFA